jgi:hypothetical protein
MCTGCGGPGSRHKKLRDRVVFCRAVSGVALPPLHGGGGPTPPRSGPALRPACAVPCATGRPAGQRPGVGRRAQPALPLSSQRAESPAPGRRRPLSDWGPPSQPWPAGRLKALLFPSGDRGPAPRLHPTAW